MGFLSDEPLFWFLDVDGLMKGGGYDSSTGVSRRRERTAGETSNPGEPP
jgi:hypothetical protein